MSKKEFLCLKPLAVDMDEYGIDFVAGRVYLGDEETGYVESSENGTSVLFDGDLYDYFVEFDRSRGNADEQFREYMLDNAMVLAKRELNRNGFVQYMLPNHDYCVDIDVDRDEKGPYYLLEPQRVVCGELETLGFLRMVEYKNFEELRCGLEWCLDLIDRDQTMKLVKTLTDAKTRSEIRGDLDGKGKDDFVM